MNDKEDCNRKNVKISSSNVLENVLTMIKEQSVERTEKSWL